MAATTGSSTLPSGWRVVFLHGLESGPQGRKAQDLCASFGKENVLVPDLQMSLWNPSKRNSAIRKAGSLRGSLNGCMDEAMRSIAEAQEADPRKLCLVGSSWGGLVAMRLVCERKLEADRMLLMAPALEPMSGFAKTLMWPTGLTPSPDDPENTLDERFAPLANGRRRIKVLHGTCDDTVALAGSRKLRELFPKLVDLEEVEGGDHTLNEALGLVKPNGNGKELGAVCAPLGALCSGQEPGADGAPTPAEAQRHAPTEPQRSMAALVLDLIGPQAGPQATSTRYSSQGLVAFVGSLAGSLCEQKFIRVASTAKP